MRVASNHEQRFNLNSLIMFVTLDSSSAGLHVYVICIMVCFKMDYTNLRFEVNLMLIFSVGLG